MRNVGTVWGLRSGLLARYLPLPAARLHAGHGGSQPQTPPIPKRGCEALLGSAMILDPRARHRRCIKHLQKESSRAGAATSRDCESISAHEADLADGEVVLEGKHKL